MLRHWLTNVYAGASEVLGPLNREKADLQRKKADVIKNTAITFVMADLPKARQSYRDDPGPVRQPG